VNVGIESSFNEATRELTVNVELYYTDNSAVSSNFINVALIQDSVIGPQTEAGWAVIMSTCTCSVTLSPVNGEMK
jgi:hypothetical protein